MNTHYAPTEAYPLRWPDGWPKTPAADRTRGHQFKQAGGEYGKTPVTFSRARRLLLEELERLGAESAVISSSIDIRIDGVPRSGVNPDRLDFKEPGVALYFMLKGRAMVMAQDAFDNPAAKVRSLGPGDRGDALAGAARRRDDDEPRVRRVRGAAAARRHEAEAALVAGPALLRQPGGPRAALGRQVKARFNTLAKKMHPDPAATPMICRS
jgi:hypothetical protein